MRPPPAGPAASPHRQLLAGGGQKTDASPPGQACHACPRLSAGRRGLQNAGFWGEPGPTEALAGLDWAGGWGTVLMGWRGEAKCPGQRESLEKTP